MSIKGNISTGVIPVLTTDTVLVRAAGDVTRTAVTSGILHNDGTASATVTVSVYSSPDLTTASGSRIGIYAVEDNKQVLIDAIIGQGFPSGQNVIAVADVVGCNALITKTNYSGDS